MHPLVSAIIVNEIQNGRRDAARHARTTRPHRVRAVVRRVRTSR
jgi:hypothetical protein